MTLSTNATVLLEALKINSLHAQNAIYILFPKPQYVGTMDNSFTTEEKIQIQTAYWQWDCNLYGIASIRPVNGIGVHFYKNVDIDYSAVTVAAIRELKDNGLAYSKNIGYNEYAYHAK